MFKNVGSLVSLVFLSFALYLCICLSKFREHLEELLKGHQGVSIQALEMLPDNPPDVLASFLYCTRQNLIAAMLESELLKHSQSGILSCPVGEGGPAVDTQVHKYPWSISQFIFQ